MDINSTTEQLCQRMARHRKNHKSCLQTIQTPRNTILTQLNRLFLLQNTHAKTESNSKRKKVDILKMIRTVSTDVLLVGLEWKIAAAQESITFNSKKYQNREY